MTGEGVNRMTKADLARRSVLRGFSTLGGAEEYLRGKKCVQFARYTWGFDDGSVLSYRALLDWSKAWRSYTSW